MNAVETSKMQSANSSRSGSSPSSSMPRRLSAFGYSGLGANSNVPAPSPFLNTPSYETVPASRRSANCAVTCVLERRCCAVSPSNAVRSNMEPLFSCRRVFIWKCSFSGSLSETNAVQAPVTGLFSARASGTAAAPRPSVRIVRIIGAPLPGVPVEPGRRGRSRLPVLGHLLEEVAGQARHAEAAELLDGQVLVAGAREPAHELRRDVLDVKLLGVARVPDIHALLPHLAHVLRPDAHGRERLHVLRGIHAEAGGLHVADELGAHAHRREALRLLGGPDRKPGRTHRADELG